MKFLLNENIAAHRKATIRNIELFNEELDYNVISVYNNAQQIY